MCASQAHMSGQKQRVIGCLLQGEPEVVQLPELLDVSLSVADCSLKVPCPQILEQTGGGIAE